MRIVNYIMTKAKLILILLVIGSLKISAQEIKTYDFKGFEPILHRQTDSIYLINFWATWCVPCIKEIPALNELTEKYSGTKLKVIMVSMDMPNQIESRLIPFIEKKNIKAEVILLDDPDFNTWIDKVSPDWSGGIPATLIYSKNSRTFYEKSFEFVELDSIIKTKFNKL